MCMQVKWLRATLLDFPHKCKKDKGLSDGKTHKCKRMHTNTQIHSLSVRSIPHCESPWLHFKALWLTVANDEHSDEEQRDSDPDSTLKKPLPTKIKDEKSCPTPANVRLSTHTYIHKRVHRQLHLSCKCKIITVLSEGRKLACLLKIAILKRFIDVMLVNGGEIGESLSTFYPGSWNEHILQCGTIVCILDEYSEQLYNEITSQGSVYVLRDCPQCTIDIHPPIILSTSLSQGSHIATLTHIHT